MRIYPAGYNGSWKRMGLVKGKRVIRLSLSAPWLSFLALRLHRLPAYISVQVVKKVLCRLYGLTYTANSLLQKD